MNNTEALKALKVAWGCLLVQGLHARGVTKEQMGFLRMPVDFSNPELVTFHFDYMTKKGREIRQSLMLTREEAELGLNYCATKMFDSLKHFIEEIMELHNG